MCTRGTLVTLVLMKGLPEEMPVESIRELRAHLADVVDRADRSDEATIVTRRGKEVAAVVPIQMLRQYRIWEDRYYAELVAKRMKSSALGIPLEEVMAELLEE